MRPKIVKPPDLKMKFRFKRGLNGLDRVHKKVDDALSLISMNSNLIEMIYHPQHIELYHHSLTVLQNDFWIVTKMVMASRMAGAIMETSASPNRVIKTLNMCRQLVTIYITLLILIIFMSERMLG